MADKTIPNWVSPELRWDREWTAPCSLCGGYHTRVGSGYTPCTHASADGIVDEPVETDEWYERDEHMFYGKKAADCIAAFLRQYGGER